MLPPGSPSSISARDFGRSDLIPVIATEGLLNGTHVWRISAVDRWAILVPSPYAYQKASWLVPAEFFVSTKSPLAAGVLERIREFYAIEAEIRGHTAEYRRVVRQDRSRHIVDALHAWLHDHAGRVSAASDLAKAICYAIRHWLGLVVFLDDGRVEMETNVVERAIRPNTLTRKNALFAGSIGGARHWAMAMTLILTAKLNAIDPMAWLTDVIERIVHGQTKTQDLHTLLPWTWNALRSTLDTRLAA